MAWDPCCSLCLTTCNHLQVLRGILQSMRIFLLDRLRINQAAIGIRHAKSQIHLCRLIIIVTPTFFFALCCICNLRFIGLWHRRLVRFFESNCTSRRPSMTFVTAAWLQPFCSRYLFSHSTKILGMNEGEIGFVRFFSVCQTGFMSV